MNLPLKAAVLTSVALLLFFGYTLLRTLKDPFPPSPESLASIEVQVLVPGKNILKEDVLKGLPESHHPFKPLFFETMKLYGVRKDSGNHWIALFSALGSAVISLEAGQTFEGVILNSVDDRGCTVRYGNVERTFSF
ncbi:MAG: hypothetical protein WA705_24685 [Candidatus Ozemobacteraceae bacterium]